MLTNRIKALDAADLVLICVPTPVDEQLRPDPRILRQACASVVRHARPGQTLVLTSTTYVGTTRELLAAYDAAGEPIPPMPIAHGLGLGFDPPVVSQTLSAAGEDDRLDAGMVLAITGYVWQEGLGAVFRRDTVLVTEAGAEVLTDSPSFA